MTHTHTLNQIALRTVSVLRHAVTCTSVRSSYETTMMKWKGVPMVSNKSQPIPFKMQVRVDDQSTYPHHMSTGYVSRGVDMGASAPCSSLYNKLLGTIVCWLWVFGTDFDTHRSPTVGDSFSNYEVVFIYRTYDPKTVDLYVGSFTKPVAWYIYTCDSKKLDLHGSAFDPKTVNLDILTF